APCDWSEAHLGRHNAYRMARLYACGPLLEPTARDVGVDEHRLTKLNASPIPGFDEKPVGPEDTNRSGWRYRIVQTAQNLIGRGEVTYVRCIGNHIFDRSLIKASLYH